MSYLYLLAGDDQDLAEAELNGFLESQGIEERARMNSGLAETGPEPGQLRRLALTHEVSRKICEAEDIESLKTGYRPEKSFAVRAENLTEGERDTKTLEKELGELLDTKSNSVDLENPETVIRVYALEEKIVLGELVEDIDRGLFEKRKNQERPFSSPVSLDPVLGRVLVNLSGVKPGEHLLDPFCGTGGILIEAGLCGVGVKGLDIKEEMVSGSERNLEEYGVINHDVREGDVSEAKEIFDLERFSAIVTDLPYGQASMKTEDSVEEFLELIEGFEGSVVFMWHEDELGGYEADFSRYIHGNLTRYVFVV